MKMAIAVVGRILWAGVMLGAAAGGYLFGRTVIEDVLLRPSPDMQVPQFLAVVTSSLALAVIPYVAARGWDELTKSTEVEP